MYSAQTPVNGQNTNFMDLMKSQMTTMFMMKSMSGGNDQSSGSNIYNSIYLLVITQIIDFIMKYLPSIINAFYSLYLENKVNKYKDQINVVITADNVIKQKKSSIVLTIRIGDQENVIGQALMDYITNCKNTTHVSYKNKNYMLNQRDVIEIQNDIYGIMTQSNDNSMELSTMHGNTQNNNANMPTQQLEIYSFEKTVDELRAFLETVKHNYLLSQKNKLGNTKCYFNMIPKNAMKIIGANNLARKDYSRLPPNMAFSMKRFSTNRKFTNLFGEDIDIIKNRVKFFINNKSWYDEKGIPYSLGLLLSGNPGTGKTSTIKCLANETGRHIFNINLNNDITKTQLENLFFNEMVQLDMGEPYCIPLDQRIYVLEDVDCQSSVVLQRDINKTDIVENTDENKNEIDLSFLLNLLDGVLEMPGRIVIMTSNFPDSLDTALIRPGRIDIIAKFTCCSYSTIIKMFEFFYDINMTSSDSDLIRTTDEYKITPAEMSRIMFENFNDLSGAIDKYLNYVNKTELLSDSNEDVAVSDDSKTINTSNVAETPVENKVYIDKINNYEKKEHKIKHYNRSSATTTMPHVEEYLKLRDEFTNSLPKVIENQQAIFSDYSPIGSEYNKNTWTSIGTAYSSNILSVS